MIVYCGTVVPSCSCQMSARWLSITSQNACEHSVNKSVGNWLQGVLVLRWIALQNGFPGNCSGLCSCSSDTEEENQKTVGVHPIYSCGLLKGKFYTLYENLREHPIKLFSYFRMNISTFDDQQLAYLGSDVILCLSLCLGVRAVIYFSRLLTVGTHNYRRLSAELEDNIVLPLTCHTVCAVPLTP